MGMQAIDDQWAFGLDEAKLGDDGVVITPRGELDIATAPALRERINEVLEGGARRLVIDLSPVTFMDSVALAVILHARTTLGARGRFGVVVPEDSYTHLVFEIAGMLPTVRLFETLEDALADAGGLSPAAG
jgi:anti-sigma B factor antagonist